MPVIGRVPFHICTLLFFPGINPLPFSLSAKPFLATEVSPNRLWRTWAALASTQLRHRSWGPFLESSSLVGTGEMPSPEGPWSICRAS
jgi:hypothetical protein